ncbi:hypothetical protein [Streptomyces sp. NPDC001880]
MQDGVGKRGLVDELRRVSFGAKNAVVCEGVVSVGDVVEVAEWLGT